ncbi:organoarsenical effux MFS transporter ArsJ [Magnetovibrio sp.]|uniref:organoarsenical effux MFS transporter ArsJ n=1 Tax=Magnetovibrio sp. TaxID=2024836 RepID=UPI002F94F0FA
MSADVRNYALVTAAYWGFTLTDGALRMLVLLHFHTLGYSPFEIALLFLLYEFFGIVTNLIGGWVASRLGLKVTLFAGLALQVTALSLLALFDPSWPVWLGVSYVMGAQALSGIAKDLTKMSSKSAVKLLVPEGEHGALFKWVAVLTGSKNALKGMGFFLGGLLLALFGFAGALAALAGGLAVVLAASVLLLPGHIGQAKTKVKFSQILSKSRAMNYLSLARLFLFCSRDIWFVVGLPLFLSVSMGWDHAEVGGYMAAWVIAYGFVQALAPKLVRKSAHAPDGALSRRWILILLAVMVVITAAVWADVQPGLVAVLGLAVFGFVFAVNSAVHSYLVLAYTEAEHVALNVGFYYMANAAGRLVGTLLSGLAYQWGGLTLCLAISSLFLLLAWLFSLALPRPTQPQTA